LQQFEKIVKKKKRKKEKEKKKEKRKKDKSHEISKEADHAAAVE